ncbi:substrate-binding domain-containing protein [Haloarcula marismortui]|uniref:Phosphate ABC transporter binding n=2 Tax=Haloarcula marismortui TaxID=2238 RepID=Q5V0G0_HALMA|nr:MULTISPECIES: substrate-binding domain-containing protein [Haloarcula]AAV46993.1 phosphate ABC transporter binding [Haloarcula marismortui ATCC 43049]EMA16467.1 phosphate ABC transporter binding protein [Haloarcula californiae ATCC 33799]QCP91694.1 phosphate ABC transporter substrate-binding protein [Haloarcula marismortui ATCC 43049]
MAHDSNGLSEFVSRRKFIATTGATSIAAIAGCSSGSSDSGSDGSSGGSEDTEAPATEMDATEMDATEEGGSSDTSALESGGSSTVYPIANTAASYWNANRPASDSEYWPHGEYDIDTDQNLADYWAGLYGFEAGGEDGPPFQFTVGLSHSGTGVEKVMNGQNDMGNSSGNVEDELPDRDSYDQFIDHVVGVDGQPLVVSQEIADAGVEQITGDQLKSLYKGELTNWSELGGPDREIQVLGRVKGSGTRTSFVSNVFGNPEEDTSVANRYGQNQRLAQAIAQADNAISYLALAFIDTDGLAPVGLEWEGTTYSYQDDENGLDSTAYPLSRDLHMYTWEGTSKKEAAVINMILSDFGQDTFVAPNNYFKLGARRREEERAKLPDQV